MEEETRAAVAVEAVQSCGTPAASEQRRAMKVPYRRLSVASATNQCQRLPSSFGTLGNVASRPKFILHASCCLRSHCHRVVRIGSRTGLHARKPRPRPSIPERTSVPVSLHRRPGPGREPVSAGASAIPGQVQKNSLAARRKWLAPLNVIGADKDRAMARFAAGETQLLIATTVIEVGGDVPAAPP